MLRAIRDWWQRRKEKKAARYADEYGWMDPQELERLRRQQSPLRGRPRGSR